MPVRFLNMNRKPAARANRGRGFDAAITELAPAVASIQADGFCGIQQIADRLNNMGLATPTGRSFSLTTTNRILKRLKEMGLAAGPLTSAGSRRQAAKSRRK